MKKLTSLLTGCSLALTGALLAQQPEDQSTTPPKAAAKGKAHPAEAKPKANEVKPAGVAPEAKKPAHAPGAPKEERAEVIKSPEAPAAEKLPEPAGKHHPGAKAEKAPAMPPAAAATTNAAEVSTPAAAATSPGGKKHAKAANAKSEMKAAEAAKTPAAAAVAAPTSAANPAAQPRAKAAAVKQADPQKITEIKAAHANFHAQPKPEQVPAATFNQSRRIEGSEQWQGPQYEAFRAYHPERHDENWYHSHYGRVELIGGGYYYQHDGYWYPAWGYNRSSEYYAYDGPIYAGHRAEPPDRVIADVQAELQHMEYYKGDVDGLLGPLTREALTDYQADQGLARTAAIDEPTLDALGMD